MKDHVEKDRYKELKDMMRDEKDLAKKLDYYGLGQLYKTVAEETGLNEAYTNLAYVYEVLGNYTRAMEIYKDLEDQNGIDRVKFFVNERDQLNSFGKDFFEPEI
jgi:tetratricopeptide (TPR) repeat protein